MHIPAIDSQEDYGNDILTHMAVTLIKRAATDKTVSDEMYRVNAVGFVAARFIAFGASVRFLSETRKEALHNLYAAYYAV